MTDLSSTYCVESLKRSVAPLGSFDTLNPGVTDQMIAGFVADAFAMASLDGWFSSSTLDQDLLLVEPDLSPAELSLVMAYARYKWLQNQYSALQNRKSYTAGPAKYEIEQSASVIVALMKSAYDELTKLRKDLSATAVNGGLLGVDAYGARQEFTGVGWA